jgi:hypothetical protein
MNTLRVKLYSGSISAEDIFPNEAFSRAVNYYTSFREPSDLGIAIERQFRYSNPINFTNGAVANGEKAGRKATARHTPAL